MVASERSNPTQNKNKNASVWRHYPPWELLVIIVVITFFFTSQVFPPASEFKPSSRTQSHVRFLVS